MIMILNTKHNQFVLLFPPDFYTTAIQEKYKMYHNQLLIPYDKVDEFMSSTIQSVDFPGWTMEGPQQIRPLGAEQEFKSSKPVKDLIKREFTVKFKLADGFMNYFLFFENAIDFLDFNNAKQYFDTMTLGLMGNEGYLLAILNFHKILLNGMSEFSLSYSAVGDDFNTFDAKFTYMDWDVDTFFAESKPILL